MRTFQRMRAASARVLSITVLTVMASAGHAQVSTTPPAGIRDRTPRVVAITHARLVIKPGVVVDDGTLLVRDGLVAAAGARVSVPAGAQVVDAGGRTVYPGFIDAQSRYAQPAEASEAAAAAPARRAAAVTPAPTGARHWNRLVHPETDLAEQLKPDAKSAGELRRLGFTSVLSTPQSGIFRGQGALVSTADAERLNEVLLAPRAAQQLAFEQGAWPSDEYPGSLMGAIALIRQTLLDARWQQEHAAWAARHAGAERGEANLALAALAPVVGNQQPVIFATSDELDYARALAIAREFKLRLALAGNGHEYRRVAELKAAGVPVIVPLATNEAPAVEDPDRALDVSLAELEHWEWAPYNARVLAEAGVPFALTAAGLKKLEEQFWPALRKAIAAGLDETAALAALTVQPAALLGVSDRLGTLEPGRQAQFLIADADLFRSDTARIHETWVDGKRYVIGNAATPDPRGHWTLSWSGLNGPAALDISGELASLNAKAGNATFPVTLGEQQMLLYPPGELVGGKDRVAIVATLEADRFSGRVALPGGAEARVVGTRERAATRTAAAAAPKPALPGTLRYPAGEYGRAEPPASPRALVVRHATVWTQGAQGRLDDADMLVVDGRVRAVGRDLKAPTGALEIDGRGKHVTPGLIDAHSHIAIARGVNEGSHAVTSEVRIGDVLDPTDISIYRQLAGGTTAAQLLHGSANPIGGQSQIIKLRWGADADGLRLAGATPTIKFALGENVKQANWGESFTTRYPQTRMGVPELITDSFLAAQDYAERAKAKGGEPQRRDLRLEALAEILAGQRLVQIHSYRQDEILAFARVAERFHIVPTFQHVLEGYKVADVLAKLGAGASTFSDWWAYKMEVVDAIPYNGALMARQGVVVSFNSDSDELGRRLNVEAAKAVKYGGLSETEALDFVTRNPARQLHLDQRIGSLEAGHDADFVIWNAHPLSTLAYPEQTWIDGRKYFDRADDAREQARIEAERARLIAKMLPERVKALAKADKGTKDKPTPAEQAAAELFEHGWHSRLASWRTPYHNSEPVDVCTDEEIH
ncbi:MAG: amidohydrolase family protein [Rhodanobacteraceae bacterium]|jgi:imidazolonepropionase-like amidohydrolase|nr:amidohydrolase family protein [Rhodanobacteraceae bacterium]